MTNFDNQFDWYGLWTKQSKNYFDAVEKNFNKLFVKEKSSTIEEQLQMMQQCLEMFKQQWEQIHSSQNDQAHQVYFKMLQKMYNDACELMFEQWSNRLKQNDPVQNIKELYELWLHCCQATYQNTLHSKSFQDANEDWMKAGMRFWEMAIPTK